jgi:hypothetical protein
MNFILGCIAGILSGIIIVALCDSKKISDLEFSIGLKDKEIEILRARLKDEYQTGWNEAMHTCAKLAQKKRSAGGECK